MHNSKNKLSHVIVALGCDEEMSCSSIRFELGRFTTKEEIGETGGSHGIRDLGLLQSAVARPTTAFDHNDLYPDLFFQSYSLMHSLIKNHPFVDGKKRTSISVASIFLIRNS